MKKINKNLFLFLAVILFLLTGLFSNDLGKSLISSAKTLIKDIVSGKQTAFENFTKNVDACSESLNHWFFLLDLNSIKENFMGTRILFKDETTVVKSDSGQLLGYIQTAKYSEKELQKKISYIKGIQTLAEKNGAHFLYCAVAPKTAYATLPPNYPAYNTLNYQQLLLTAADNDIPLLDSLNFFDENNLSGREVFFQTDHHWTPLAGFYLHGAICKELMNRYGFSYNPEYTNLDNYNVETRENWFLGSFGKKCGRFFTGSRVDDFDLITPLFQTEFIEEIPSKNRVRTGEFINTLLYTGLLKKDYYQVNNYSVYSGGDYRLQKITNCSIEDGDVLLVVRRSYGCVVTPFLALHAKELHVIDDREGSYPAGEIINLEEYIKSIQPDYVILLN